MASYQAPHNFDLTRGGENDNETLSADASHPEHVVQGAMEHARDPLPTTQIPTVNEAEEANGFDPTHTCATCKATCPNNHALEQHAAKKRHKAFQCTCTTKFVRLATLTRHIAAQAGPKHHCTYCDNKKGLARQDKLIDHLRASHKFGDQAIAQFRSQARAQPQVNGHASSAAATTGTALPVSTSAGFDAVPGGTVGQAGYSDGPSDGPAGIVDGGLPDFPMFSIAEIQPFGSVEDYPLYDGTKNLMDLEFSGIDFAGVDSTGVGGDLDMSGMDNIL